MEMLKLERLWMHFTFYSCNAPNVTHLEYYYESQPSCQNMPIDLWSLVRAWVIWRVPIFWIPAGHESRVKVHVQIVVNCLCTKTLTCRLSHFLHLDHSTTDDRYAGNVLCWKLRGNGSGSRRLYGLHWQPSCRPGEVWSLRKTQLWMPTRREKNNKKQQI